MAVLSPPCWTLTPQCVAMPSWDTFHPRWDLHCRVYPKEINFELLFMCLAARFTVGCKRWVIGPREAQGITNLLPLETKPGEEQNPSKKTPTNQTNKNHTQTSIPFHIPPLLNGNPKIRQYHYLPYSNLHLISALHSGLGGGSSTRPWSKKPTCDYI